MDGRPYTFSAEVNAGLIAGYFVTTLKKSKQQITPTSLVLIQFCCVFERPLKEEKKKPIPTLHSACKKNKYRAKCLKTWKEYRKEGCCYCDEQREDKKKINRRQNESELEGNNET